MTPATVPDLWRLQGQLVELFEEREQIRERASLAGNLQPCEENLTVQTNALAELAAIDNAISAYVQDKVASVTELRAVYFGLLDAAAVAKAEARRAANRELEHLTRAEKLKELIHGCMTFLGVKRFDSAMGYFLVAGNGGKQPVEITDETLIPDECCMVTVSVRADLWKFMMACDFGDNLTNATIRELPSKRTPSKTLIEGALNKPCETCEGTGQASIVVDGKRTLMGGPSEQFHCPSCGGTGKAGVPGARLAERGSHLRIK